MTLTDWILSTLSSTTVLGLVAWAAKDVISTRLTKSVQHDFDKKLAELSSELRSGEDKFRSELQRKQTQITNLEQSLLSGRAARLAAYDKRRLEAVDDIWQSVYLLGFAKNVAATMSVMKYEALLAEAERNPKARELVSHLDLDTNKATEPSRLAQRARPFLTDLAWAYYTAYARILMHSVARALLIRLGLNNPKLMDDASLLKVLHTTLPAYSEYINEHGVSATYYLLEPLENLLLHELQQIMEGKADDLRGVERAKEIIAAANKLSQQDAS